jgi:hypothetical protein
MTLNLSEHSVDTKDVIEDVVEEDQRNVELFFVEDSETSLRVFSKLFSIDGDVVLAQPVRVEDRSSECLVAVDSREVSERDSIDVLVGPFPLLLGNESILEEPESFVSP